MLPPSRPVSNSSSTESTLTRELSRHDLSVDPGGGGATGSGSGHAMNGHHSHLVQHQQQQQNSSQRGVDALTFSKVGHCTVMTLGAPDWQATHKLPSCGRDVLTASSGVQVTLCGVALQLEKAVQHIASRVDELAIQPEVYGARVEAQLASLALEQRALQVWCACSATTYSMLV